MKSAAPLKPGHAGSHGGPPSMGRTFKILDGLAGPGDGATLSDLVNLAGGCYLARDGACRSQRKACSAKEKKE